jgi:rhodanese-related sulfurtransferase
METISREELKAKIDRGDDFKLVMTLAEWAFQMSHIPGSLNITSMPVAQELLDKGDEIVVYCSDEQCLASRAAYMYLTGNGYKNVRRYSGGLSDWEAAGYSLKGEGHPTAS